MKKIRFKRFETPDKYTAEAMNTLCTNLSFVGSSMKKILVSSTHENEGKSFLTMQIMRTMAHLGKKVVLVDADFRKSVIGGRYGFETDGEMVGLAHFLAGYQKLDEVLYETPIEDAYIIPVGRDIATPLPLLTSGKMESLLNYLAANFDLVLVDTPPVGMVIDSAEIGKYCDGAILVVECNNVRRRDLKYSRNQLERSGCPVLGCVLNKVDYEGLGKRYYYYSSSYYYSDYSK